MTHRQIVLDTETTGIRVEDGHRIIEIACVEMIDRKLTGKHFHCYVNPEREVEAGALAIHGITNNFLSDKPFFSHISNELIEFITGAELVIHNAPFDVAFLNSELSRFNKKWKMINDYCSIIDTLQIARRLHVGQRNNLDALCKRYSIDNSKREFHGALLDAHLLAQVYLCMTGGQGSFFDMLNDIQLPIANQMNKQTDFSENKYNLIVLKATKEELSKHKNYIELMGQQGNILWGED